MCAIQTSFFVSLTYSTNVIKALSLRWVSLWSLLAFDDWDETVSVPILRDQMKASRVVRVARINCQLGLYIMRVTQIQFFNQIRIWMSLWLNLLIHIDLNWSMYSSASSQQRMCLRNCYPRGFCFGYNGVWLTMSELRFEVRRQHFIPVIVLTSHNWWWIGTFDHSMKRSITKDLVTSPITSMVIFLLLLLLSSEKTKNISYCTWYAAHIWHVDRSIN